MCTSCRSLARVGSGLFALFLVAGRAAAEEGLQIRPALSVSQVHDDNIFSARGVRVADDIWRLSPRLEIAHRPGRFTLFARGGVDGEKYQGHPELDTATARQEADLRIGWVPTRRFIASATASYAESATAGELNTLVGLTVGRVPARRLAATAAFAWQIGARTELGADHAFTRDEVETLPDSDAQTASLAVSRQVRTTDQARVRYSAKRFVFDGLPTLSHVVTLGWKREVSPVTHFEFAAGPARSGGTLAAEASASVRQQFRRGEATFGYLRTQTTVVGRPGPVTAEGVAATFSRRLWRSVQVSAAPSVFRVVGGASRTTIQQVNVEVRCRLSRQLSLVLSDAYTVQRGGLYLSDDPGLDTSDVVRNILALRIVAGSAGH